MRDLIKVDVHRTLQEFDYFHKVEVKDSMTQLLYLWGRENPDYGYKQGMNEILAMIMLVFDSERCQPSATLGGGSGATDAGKDSSWWDTLSDEQIASEHFL